MSRNILLISDTIIKERTTVHGNIDPKLLYPEIKVAQDMYIHPILGTPLFNKLLSDIDGNSLAGNYLTLLTDYIIDPLMYYTIAELPMGLSYQFWNKGVVRKSGDNTELPDMSELIDLHNHYRKRAEWYGERLTKYLKQNASSSVLPEYLERSGGIDQINPEGTAFSSQIYLGPERECYSLDKYNCRGEEHNC